MASFGIFDTLLLYSFVKRLVTPFNKWKAFDTGVIDEDGNIIVPQDKRTPDQNRSFKLFDLLVLNIKKMLGKVPGGKSRIATYAAALMLLREGEELEGVSEAELFEKIVEYLERDEQLLIELQEDAPTNSAGDGANVAGLDNNPPADPKKMRKKLLRRMKCKVSDNIL